MVVDSSVISASGLVYFVFDFVGILRSRWIVSLVTYQAAFIRDLSVFDWKRRSISMLELLAVPHSWIP